MSSRFARGRAPEIVAGLAYACLLIFVALHHEPWRDEADPWLVARDAGLLGTLRLMGYVGTPALWHLTLTPFARLGCPYGTMEAIHVALAIGAAWLFLARAPFPLLTRILFVFGYYMAFEYAVIARSYVLSAILLFGVAATFPRRLERPLRTAALIALLVNTNAHSFFLGGALGLLLLHDLLRSGADRRATLATLAVLGAGVGAAFWQLYPPADGQIPTHFFAHNWPLVPRIVGQAFFPTQHDGWEPWAGGLLLIAGTLSVVDRPRLLALLLGSLGGLLYIFVFKYSGYLRHFGFVQLAVLVVLWLEADERPPGAEGAERARDRPAPQTAGRSGGANGRRMAASLGRVGAGARRVFPWLWGASLLLSCAATATSDYLEVVTPFSGSRDAARWLLASGRLTDDVVVAAHTPSGGEAVLAHLPPRQLYYPGIRSWGSHMKWDRALLAGEAASTDQVVTSVLADLPAERRVLLVINRPLRPEDLARFRLLYRSEQPLAFHYDETYWIYERLR